MAEITIWWLGATILGIIGLPLARWMFPTSASRGIFFARPLGLLVAGYLWWIGGSMGVLDTSRASVVLLVVLLLGGATVVIWREREAWIHLRRWPILVAISEGLFSGSLVVVALLRSYSPEITAAGGEKYMDFAFLNAVTRSSGFPPADPWLAGFHINYYYFGYVMMGLVTQLSGLSPAVAFNLALALAAALTITGAYGLVYDLVARADARLMPHALVAGGLGSVFVALMGNLEGLLEILRAWGLGPPDFWSWIGLPALMREPSGISLRPVRFIWWWQASRVIYDGPLGRGEVITEFPAFSFLLGDLHPHVMALPFALLALACSVAFLRRLDPLPAMWRAPGSVLYPLAIGALGFLNTWDLPTYGALVLLAYAINAYVRHATLSWGWVVEVLSMALPYLTAALALYAPFYLNFQSYTGGIRLILWLPKTRLQQYLIMFGPFVVMGGSYLMVLLWRRWHISLQNGLGSLLLVPSLAILSILAAGTALLGWWTAAMLSGLLAISLLVLWKQVICWGSEWDGGLSQSLHVHSAHTFALLALGLALALNLATEFVYVDDVFHNRMNTIFKTYYQAWILWGVAAAWAVIHLVTSLRARWVWALAILPVCLAAAVYTPLAAIARSNDFRSPPVLDGTAYLAREDPDEAATIAWLRTLPGRPVILEASGTSYVDEGRLSAWTGLPTLLGWSGHERQWRGALAELRQREDVIRRIYQGRDSDDAQRLIAQYAVRYVVLGPREWRRYQLGEDAIAYFAGFMDLVWERGAWRVYAVR